MRFAFRSTLFCVVCVLIVLTLSSLSLSQAVPGQNVNMVSGTKWPGGDPFLQRQNEPSIAVSTRNPQHLLAGANDYRTVDLPAPDQLTSENAGDAWLGVFKSFDGGATWQSTLIPGYPQDTSAAGRATPMKRLGLTTGADPVVRAGANGMFYYGGLSFTRGTNTGMVFVSRFIDLNNKENGDATQNLDPIVYLNTVPVNINLNVHFLDKPWIATDIPRPGAGMCTISTGTNRNKIVQTFPAGNVYMSYTVLISSTSPSQGRVYFSRSTDCGNTWGHAIEVDKHQLISQGSIVQVDPSTGYVYVAWRQFSKTGVPNAILVAKSTNGGVSFSAPVTVASFPNFDPNNPAAPTFFDQGISQTSFRTNAYPAMGIDGAGQVYMAWSQRNPGPNGDARIMMTTSMDGVSWSTPTPIDNGVLTDDFGNQFARGHQIMPSISVAGGKVMVLYYDLRLDHTMGFFTPNSPFDPNGEGNFYEEDRAYEGEPQDQVFTPFIDDFGLTLRRHTIEVMVSEAVVSPLPQFTSTRVSQYRFGERGDSVGTVSQLSQLQVDPPNLPLFVSGTEPFFGDYIEISGQYIIPDGNGGWQFNTAPQAAPTFYATWTSNQDVRPPLDGNWSNYTPSGLGQNRQSVFDPTQTEPNCVPGQEGMRNQNIYFSQITQGLKVTTPQDFKPLSMTLQRTFVVLVSNTTSLDRLFHMSIANQPAGGMASWIGVANDPVPSPLPSPVTDLDVIVPAHSGISRPVFALSSNPTASVLVNVNEITANGGAGLSGFVILNGDPTNPSLVTPDGAPSGGNIQSVEIYNPNVSNPNVSNPNVSNPNVSNPNVSNPNVSNPNVSNPNVSNPDLANPNVSNPNVSNNNVANPNVSNPNVSNPNVSNAPVSDATYTVTNAGNTTTSYHVQLFGNQPTGVQLQLILSKTYQTPVSVNCQLMTESQDVIFANINNPVIFPPDVTPDPNLLDGSPTNATFALAPGDTGLITLRGYTDIPTMETIISQVTPVVIPHPANTNVPGQNPSPVSPLLITTSSLPAGQINVNYPPVQLQATGGTGTLTWSSPNIPEGMSFSTAGVLGGAPVTITTYQIIFNVADSANPPHTASRTLTLVVTDANFIHFVSQPVNVSGGQTNFGSGANGIKVVLTDASNAVIPGANITMSVLNGCSSAILSGTLTQVTDATGIATFPDLSIDRGSNGYQMLASLTAEPGIATASTPFNVIGFCPTGSLAPVFSPPDDANPTNARQRATATLLPSGMVLVAGGTDDFGATVGTAELYDPITGSFIPTGTMNVPRSNSTATLLPNGRVLVAGGIDNTGLVSSVAEVYDPASGVFLPTATAMTIERSGHAATILNDGRVAIFGGQTGAALATSTVEIYDPLTNSFTAAAGSMNTARANLTATLLENEDVLLAGGSGTSGGVLNSLELFNAPGPTFTSLSATLSQRREFAGASLLPNGQVLISGGDSGVESSPLASADIFNPSGNTITGPISMVRGHEFHSSTVLPDGTVLIAGGSDAFFATSAAAQSEVFTPGTNTFASTGSLQTPRYNHVSSLLANGNMLAIGGFQPQGVGPIGSVEVYNSPAPSFAPGAFSQVGPMVAARSFYAASALQNGKVLLTGGFDAFQSNFLASSELFDPITNRFTISGDMTQVRSGQTATVLPNGNVLIAGGDTSVSTGTAELYDPVTGQFTALPNTTYPRQDGAALLLSNGTVLLAGGNLPFSSTGTAAAEIYDPVANTFTSISPMHAGRAYFTMVQLNNGKVLLAGGDTSGPGGVSTAEIYDPVAQTFSAPLNFNDNRQNAATILLPDGRVLVAGGGGFGNSVATADVFTASGLGGSIAATANNMSTPRSGPVAGPSGGGKALVTGGFIFGEPILDTNTTDIFDPTTNSFSTGPNMAMGRDNLQLVVLPNGNLLVIGGEFSSQSQSTADAELYVP